MTRVLITGASGFVGGHLALGLADCGFEVIALGGSRKAVTAAAGQLTSVSPFSLCSAEEVASTLKAYAPDVIVHAAALADAARCQKEPDLAGQINVLGTNHFVSYYKRQEAKNHPLLLYISTDLVYEGKEAPVAGFSEEDPALPCSVYAKSKHQAEASLSDYPGSASTLRICLTYGPALTFSWGQKQGFLGWMLEALKHGSPLKLFSDEWRTPVHVDDITQTVRRLIEVHAGGTIVPSLLHVAGESRISRSELGFLLAETYDLDSSLIEITTRDAVPMAAPRAKDVSLSSAKLRQTLGFSPRTIAAGLKQVWETETKKY